MRKTAIVLFFVFFAVAFGSAVDFGGSLGDATLLYPGDTLSVYHSDNLSVWFSSPLGNDINFFAQGSYTFTTEDPYAFDLDYLKIENKSASELNYTLGRFLVSDFSGYLFRNKLDGAQVILNPAWGTINLTAGYTGLLFNRTSGVEMTLSDQSDSSGRFDFEAPRMITGLEVQIPGILLKQDLTVGAWGQFDMRKASDITSGGGKLNTGYLGVKVGGPLLSSLYYDSAVFWGTGLSTISGVNTQMLSFLGYAGLRYYLPEILSSKITARFLYSTGDADYTTSFLEGNTKGTDGMFTPVTKSSLALVFSPRLGNIFFSKVSYSLKPLSWIESRMLVGISAMEAGRPAYSIWTSADLRSPLNSRTNRFA